jgi:5-methylcytosine-specific restriction enzyme A
LGLSDLTEPAVLSAIAEFDELRRDGFLKKYGFGRSRGYFINYRGQPYDSKAIAGAAHGYIGKGLKSLRASEFSGGDKTVAKRLRELGFSVSEPGDLPFEGIPFKVGQLYHRQTDIHQIFSGQERGGIATPDGVPFLFLFTGETGTQFGYTDGWRSDGIFAYTGEGQKGDMKFVRGNKAIRDHAIDGRDLLLFEASQTKGLYIFRGCFAFASWELIDAPDRYQNMRKAIIFQLVPVDEIEIAPLAQKEIEQLDLEGKSLSELRTLALAAAATPAAPQKEARRTYFVRSEKVKAYVLKRAAGRCEACKSNAPFSKKDGSPYLEPHHIKRISDGGPDHPAFVGAVCPTCHRRIHHGSDGTKINGDLELYVRSVEKARG